MTPQEMLEKIRENVVIEDGEELHSLNYEEKFQGFFENCEEEVDWANGASRMVIIPKNENYVLKISFTKITDESDCMSPSCYDDDEWEEVEKNIHEHPEAYYTNGCGEYFYMSEPDCEDYCKKEAELYERAAKAGLGAVFAAEWYVGNLDRLRVYAQEKVETASVNENKQSDESVFTRRQSEIDEAKKSIEKMDGEHPESGKEWCNWYSEKRKNKEPIYLYYATRWFALVLLIYGYDFFVNLVQFCEDQGISDLHSGNVGFKDNKPILLDYATF